MPYKPEQPGSENQDIENGVAPDGQSGSSIETPDKNALLAGGYKLYAEKPDTDILYKINFKYHNDRAQRMADALTKRLIEAGVPAYLLNARGYGDRWTEDLATEERNYWMVLRLISD
ncbi:MAG: hypothetical protein HC819_23980 [Cyclobacteriaceae bacterium]|nr:hypothetical protein [Cyclobacteriaceae bacterium]